MKTIITVSLLGGLLAGVLCTTVLAQSANPAPSYKQSRLQYKPTSLEIRVRQLERQMQSFDARLDTLEDVVYETPPSICPCFDSEDLLPLTLQNCEITPDGVLKSNVQQYALSVNKHFCSVEAPDGITTLPITYQEYWACVLPIYNKMAAQSLTCSVK